MTCQSWERIRGQGLLFNTILTFKESLLHSLAMFALQSTDESLTILQSSHEGLAKKDVQKRQNEYGPNEIPHKKRSLLLLFLRQFNSVFVYILLFALALSAFEPFMNGNTPHAQEFLQTGAIAVILILNALLGFVQEYKAEASIDLLKKLSAPTVRVRREGVEVIIPSRDLVPGDIVILDTGDRISADGRVLRSLQLDIDESSLTGESLPVTKTTDVMRGEPGLADQKNMVFCGTVVTRGAGEFMVTATGTNMELGKIATLVSDAQMPTTPLQKQLSRLSVMLGSVVSLLAVFIVFLKLSNGDSVTSALLLGISLAVSAVPEGLPAIVTACLAIGVRRMAKRRVLVRRLEALETLGSVTVICTDKTGTVTENRMEVKDSWLPAEHVHSDERLLLEIAASCNHAQLPDIGDPTEIGLLRYALKEGVERLPIDDEPAPFSSETKFMITRHGQQLFVKGAPEAIADRINTNDGVDEFLNVTDAMASKGLRVLACAVENEGMTRFVGLLGLLDPAREGTADAVAQAKRAGIRTVMITGDNITTARSIAHSVGIDGDAMDGATLTNLSPEELKVRVRTTSVFARVSPAHKVQILESLQSNGEIVAMSGDGVNDAPALKRAHVGIAMGKNGTDVARDAASIVLTDDRYATIVEAIEEGRHITDNIRKFILSLLQMNCYELLLFATTALLGLPLPYLPLHVLWLNLLTDGLPALALGMEPAERGIMDRKPRHTREHLLYGKTGQIVLSTLLAFGIGLGMEIWLLKQGTPIEEMRTVLFTFAVLFELFFVSTVRSEQPLYKIGFFSNKWLVGALAITIALQGILLFTPLRVVFGLSTLTTQHWVVMLLCALSGLVVFEAMKIVRPLYRRR